MNCSDAMHLIHLDVGDDLRAEEVQQLAGHMERCAECRACHAGMSSAMNALLVLRDAPSAGTGRNPSAGSVWPAVSREIQKRRTCPVKARKFNLQVAALSVCSLSLAVVTIVQSLSSMRSSIERSSIDSSEVMSGLSVSSQMHDPKYPQYNRSVRIERQDNKLQNGEHGPRLPQSF